MRVKICGITNLPDALLALEAGADAIGLIFATGSPRQITPQQARDISLAVGPALGRVGVFRNERAETILRAAEVARLSAVQVHGELPQADWDALLAEYPVLRVLSPGRVLPDWNPHQSLMFDAPNPGQGQQLDWAALAAQFPAARFPPGSWLAGGLGPENVAQAIATLHPAGVDAVSSTERAPGLKDPARLRAFVQAAQQASC